MRKTALRLFALMAIAAFLFGLAFEAGAQTISNHQRAMILVSKAFDNVGKGDCSTAEKQLTQALELDRNNPWAMLDLGVVYNNSGRFDKAREMFQRVAGMDIKDKVTKAHFQEDVGLTLPQLAQRNLDNMGKPEGRVSGACPVLPKSRGEAKTMQ